jgi:hypothetical protein
MTKNAGLAADIIIFVGLLAIVLYDYFVAEVDADSQTIETAIKFYNVILPLLMLTFTARLITRLLSTFLAPEKFRDADEGTKAKIVTYCIELFFSLMLFPAACYLLIQTYVVQKDCTVTMTNDPAVLAGDCTAKNAWATTTIWLWLICMYLYEIMMQGMHLRMSLFAHHISCIALLLTVFQLTDAGKFCTATIALGWCHALLALLEQPTFFALLVYRIGDKDNHKMHARNFLFAAISFGASKLLSQIVAFYLLASNFSLLEPVFIAMYFIFVVALGMTSQIYSTWAQYCVYKKIKGKSKKIKGKSMETPGKTETSEP